ncbi:MAG TPA: hypothetical protein VFR81_24710 [Longimicrobium sp.]|nr:hypothetical protein [Longimicrobium sp.]
MLTLELSREEAADLADALRSYLNDFHDEIANTDDFDYKQALQRKRERLEGVVARLGTETHGHAAGSSGDTVRPVDGTIVREVPPSPEGGAAY